MSKLVEGVSMVYVPKLSIIVPVYNVEKYLSTCLDGALAQTLKDIEIICVDDGSTDSCSTILDEYAGRDARIRVIHKANGGYGQAVNTGMDAACGEYFAILESDDVIPENMYERLYCLARQHDLDVIKADFFRFAQQKHGEKQVYAHIARSADLYGRVIEDQPGLVLKSAGLYTWSGIYRMAFLREQGIRHNETPGASYQDNGFWFQTMSLARRVYFLNEPLYRLRRDNPDSSIKSKGKVYCIRDEFDFIHEFIERHPDLHGQVKSIYWWVRLVNYGTTYRRIAPEYKLEFARHFAQTLRLAQPELDWSLFTEIEKKELRLLLTGGENFHRKTKNKKLRDPMTASRFTYFVWYIEDHGFTHTAWYVVKKLLNVGRTNCG